MTPSFLSNANLLRSGRCRWRALHQTAHFSSVSEQLTPLTPSGATNCSAFVTTDFASLVATGNGIEQSIIYNAGDGWFTSPSPAPARR